MTINTLITALNNLTETLGGLQQVIGEERNLLGEGSVRGPMLQGVTERKSSLLATVNIQDQARRQAEVAAGVQAPYTQLPELATRWLRIQNMTQGLQQQNIQNGRLLERHILHNNAAMQVLKKHNNSTLYGPDGHSHKGSLLGRKIEI